MNSKLLFSLLLFCCGAKEIGAQDTLAKKNTLLAYPVAFYLPETRWGLGASGFYNFYLNKKDSISPPSQIQLNAAYTQNKQYGIAVPFQLFWKERKHTLTGEVGLYNLNYLYYGFGAGNWNGINEKYNAEHLQFRLNYLRKVKPNFYAGLRWWYDKYEVNEWTDIQPEPLLSKAPGAFGSTTSGPGLLGLWDTRDNIYFSFSGHYLELVAQHQDKIWGSDFAYNRYRIDYRKFIQTTKNQSVALQAFGDFISGDVPFNQMAAIGSSKRMRGFYEARFRDKNLLLLQSEYRCYFYQRFGAVAFFNYAVLSNKIEQFSLANDHASAGAGLRFAFDKNKRVNLRLDAAWPVGVGQYTDKNFAQQGVFYFTVGEAF